MIFFQDNTARHYKCKTTYPLAQTWGSWEEKPVTRYENTFGCVALFIIFEKQKHKK